MEIGHIAEVVAKLKNKKPLSEVMSQVAPEIAWQVGKALEKNRAGLETLIDKALEGDRAELEAKYYSIEEELIGPYR